MKQAIGALVMTVALLPATATWAAFNFGIHYPDSIEQAKELGVDVSTMKPQVWWSQFEPEKGRYDLAVGGAVNRLDAAISKLQEAGIDPVVTLNCASYWGTSRAAAWFEAYGGYPFCDYPDDEDVLAWRRFVRNVVERYDRDGIRDANPTNPFLRPVKYWHVVEEWPQWVPTADARCTFDDPSDDRFDEPLDAVTRYVDLLRITHEAIKEADPDAKIIVAGLTFLRILAYGDGYIADPSAGIWDGRHWSREVMNGTYQGVWTKELDDARDYYQHRKAETECILGEGRPYFDIVDVHLYMENYQWQEGIIAWLKDKMAALTPGFPPTPIVCLECGGPFLPNDSEVCYRTGNGCGDPPNAPYDYCGHDGLCYDGYNDKTNAEYVVKLLTMAAADGMLMYSWGLRDCVPTPGSICEFWGWRYGEIQLIRSNGMKKPSYYAYMQISNSLKAIREAKRLPLAEDDYVYEIKFGNHEVGYVAWNDNGNVIDLSPYFGQEFVRVTPTVTALNQISGGCYLESRAGILLSETPVFIKEDSCLGSLCSDDDCRWNEYCDKAIGRCDGFGTCEQKPLFSKCFQYLADPVCGCDGVTYGNACFAKHAGVSVRYEGRCAR